MIINFTYELLELYFMFSNRINAPAFQSGDARRAYFNQYKKLKEVFENHELSLELKEIDRQIDEFNKDATPENQTNKGLQEKTKEFNKIVQEQNERKKVVVVPTEWDSFTWSIFKDTFEKEGPRIFTSAITCSMFDDLFATVESQPEKTPKKSK